MGNRSKRRVGFMTEVFDCILQRLINSAKKQKDGFEVQTSNPSDSADYTNSFGAILRNKSLKTAVLLSDKMEDYPYDSIIDALIDKLVVDRDFSLTVYIGILEDEFENTSLKKLLSRKDKYVGKLSIFEIGMKPMLQGMFTNVGSICSDFQTGAGKGRNVVFKEVDLVDDIARYMSGYIKGMK